jgi:hypothetical protein
MDADLIEQIAYHAQMLATLGKKAGIHKITDKTKWRELVMAGKLNHQAFEKISAGKKSAKYGADAFDSNANKMAEYKSSAIEDKDLKNLLQKVKSKKTGTRYNSLTIGGVYNGAYNHESVDRYAFHDHYFGIFYDERCLLIIKPHTEYVISILRDGVNKMIAKGKGTTNLNTVKVNLKDSHLYDIVYRNDEWFAENG